MLVHNFIITLIGGPTVLMELAGLRILTDPTFDEPGSYESRGITWHISDHHRPFPPSTMNRIEPSGCRRQTVRYLELKLLTPLAPGIAMTASPMVNPKSPDAELSE